MKIEFDENGKNFISVSKTNTGVAIILSSQDKDDLKKTIVNSVELSMDEFINLISDIT